MVSQLMASCILNHYCKIHLRASLSRSHCEVLSSAIILMLCFPLLNHYPHSTVADKLSTLADI